MPLIQFKGWRRWGWALIQQCDDVVTVRAGGPAGHYWRWYGFTEARTEVRKVSLTYCDAVRIIVGMVTVYDFIFSYAKDFSLSEVTDAPWDKVGATGHWTGSGGRLLRLNIQTHKQNL